MKSNVVFLITSILLSLNTVVAQFPAWSTSSNLYVHKKLENDHTPTKDFDSEAPSTFSERKNMVETAFYEALKDLTYCYPDIKFGKIIGLTPESRDQGIYDKNYFTLVRGIKYEKTEGFHGRTRLRININWEYVNIQREDNQYAITKFNYKTRTFPYSGCYCSCDGFAGFENFQAEYESECEKANEGDLSGGRYTYYPKDYREEFVDATITIYPLIFESSSYYHQSNPEKEQWIESRQRALLFILLHEMGHIECEVNEQVKYGDSFPCDETEYHQDNFATFALRCVE